MSYSNRDALNMPFMFLEVLLDSQKRRHIQAKLASSKAFGNDSAPALDLDVATRRLAVRLRTINNACAAQFCMPNEQPVTEVSLYGSRERQFLVGPFWAVERLMKGALPCESRREVEEHVARSADALEKELGRIDRFLDAGASVSVEGVQKCNQNQKDHEGWIGKNESNGIPLDGNRYDDIRYFSNRMHATLDELRSIRSTIAESDWWWSCRAIASN